MKKCLALVCVLLLLCACGRVSEPADVSMTVAQTIPQSETQPQERTVRVAVTQLLADSGVCDVLRTAFERESTYRLDFAVNPDNDAVAVAQSGGADVLLARRDMPLERFVTAGYADTAADFLRTSLVLAGPADDPADAASAASAAEALSRIAKAGSLFVSRYDDSDLSMIEQKLWSGAGISIGNGRKWYKPARMEMTGSLRKADELGAYILCEKTAFLENRDSLSLSLLLDNTEDLAVIYAAVLVSETAFDSVNRSGADAFVDWLRSDSTTALLKTYGTDSFGCPIFELL